MDVLEVLQGVGAAAGLRHDVVNVTAAGDEPPADAAHAAIAGDDL